MRLRPTLPRSLFTILLHAEEMIFDCPPALRRFLACACIVSRFASVGAMYVSTSRTGVGVALKVPAIVQRQLFCMMLVDVFDFLGMCHTVDLYVMTRI